MAFRAMLATFPTRSAAVGVSARIALLPYRTRTRTLSPATAMWTDASNFGLGHFGDSLWTNTENAHGAE
jgi:hypothetical protein